MRLDCEFIKLPITFNVQRLVTEAQQFCEADWDRHPLRYDGNSALVLVSQGGKRNNASYGAMGATSFLEQCPYIQQVMLSMNTVIGRSRLMRLAPTKVVPPHADTDYIWRNRVRIHIPIVTHSEITFSSLNKCDVHMQAGEAWVFDNWNEHAVYNNSDVRRIHLVIDTVGTANFWQLVKNGWNPQNGDATYANWQKQVTHLEFRKTTSLADLRFENFNTMVVSPPAEVNEMLNELLDEIITLEQNAPANFAKIKAHTKRFVQEWRGLWASYSDHPNSLSYYQTIIEEFKNNLQPLLINVALKTNRVNAMDVYSQWLDAMTDIRLVNTTTTSSQESLSAQLQETAKSSKIFKLNRPIFIVGAPRSGVGMLFEGLNQNHELWTLDNQMIDVTETIPILHPKNSDYRSNRLTETVVSELIKEQITNVVARHLQNSRDVMLKDLPKQYSVRSIRLLDKTLNNALRIPFLKALFPDAQFIVVHRSAPANIASLIEAWESQSFVTYPELSNWQGLKWSMVLVERWQSLSGKSTAEIAAQQWLSVNRQIITDIQDLDKRDVVVVSHQELCDKPSQALERICTKLDIPFGPKMRTIAAQGLPFSKSVLSTPNRDKWRIRAKELEEVADIYQQFDVQQLDNY